MQGLPPPARRSGLLAWILHGSARPWSASFAGAERMVLLRPAQLFRVRRDLVPALEAAAAGVGHVVLLSLQGRTQPAGAPPGGRGPRRASPMAWTLIRATYSLQNRSTTYAPEVRERDEFWVPAGKGRTAFVDARDVAARAHTVRSHEGTACILTDPPRHRRRTAAHWPLARDFGSSTPRPRIAWPPATVAAP